MKLRIYLPNFVLTSMLVIPANSGAGHFKWHIFNLNIKWHESQIKNPIPPSISDFYGLY